MVEEWVDVEYLSLSLSLSLSLNTSGMHLQTQKCVQNTR